VTTSADSKAGGFGRLKVLLSQGRLALPRHPRLLGQLAALEFEERESGSVRIEVTQRAGHDELGDGIVSGGGCWRCGVAAQLRTVARRGGSVAAHGAAWRLGQSDTKDSAGTMRIGKFVVPRFGLHATLGKAL
jgi:hypothetical protein